jgi:hypothetical protein
MPLIGRRAGRVIVESARRISPHLPSGVRVDVSPGARHSVVLRRYSESDRHLGAHFVVEEETSSGNHGRIVASDAGIVVFAIGAWIPFLPRRLRARLAAQHAVELVLSVAYASMGEPQTHANFHVEAAIRNESVITSYADPSSFARIALAPLPLGLFSRRGGKPSSVPPQS